MDHGKLCGKLDISLDDRGPEMYKEGKQIFSCVV